MSWFNKKARPVDTAAVSPIFTFWSWWTGSAKDRFAAAVTSGAWADLPTEMSDRVRAIDPDLQWELSAGTRAQHTLCVTSAGTAELRPLAQRWKRAAPAEDDIWQYEPALRRDATIMQGQVELDGHTLDLGETLVSAVLDEHRLRFDVVVHYPQFARMEERARQFTFLILDWRRNGS